MLIERALRANRKIRMAFVGAGGKTTAMFQLARQLIPPVIVTTTTHLTIAQSALADAHFVVEGQFNLSAREIGKRIALITGPRSDDKKYSCPGNEFLHRILAIVEEMDAPLLVEADGARQLPLKAPQEHEPAIPSWATSVVVTAGLSALGKPINDMVIHRAERFASLAGLQLGDPITVESLERVLLHPLGGLKNIPSAALRIALLNQIETVERKGEIYALASRLLKSYDRVLISAMLLDDPEEQALASFEPIAGIVLAAGGATRFGKDKILETWQGTPLVRHVAQTALKAGLSPVVVVLGAVVDAAITALGDLPVQIVINPNWANGQSTSLSAGLRSVASQVGAALFLLADQPQIPAKLIQDLAALHRRTLAAVAMPQVKGRRANPVLFDQVAFEDLLNIKGDTGGRAIMERYPVAWLDWDDENILLDIDTPEDYQRLLALSQGFSC